MASRIQIVLLMILHAGSAAALGQPANGLVITHTDLSRGQARLGFVDPMASGAGYQLEFTTNLGSAWNELSSQWMAAPQGGFEIQAALPDEDRVFLRIARVENSPGPLAFFESTLPDRHEGDTVTVQIRFASPFRGVIRYSVAGSLSGPGGLGTGGDIVVDGETATLTFPLPDDSLAGDMQDLVIRLEPGSGYSVGVGASVQLSVQENDRLWRGRFDGDLQSLGIDLEWTQQSGTSRVRLLGRSDSLFPAADAGQYAASEVEFNDDRCRVFIPNVRIPATGDNGLGLDAVASLQLEAESSRAGEQISDDLIRGRATLTLNRPDLPALQTVVTGPFVLSRASSLPSTAEVELE